MNTPSKPDSKTSKKRSQWPRVRFVAGALGADGKPKPRPKPWLVDARIAGKGERYFFTTAIEADTKADLLRIARKNGGTEAAGLPSRLRADAIEADRRLAAVGASLMEAVEYFLSGPEQNRTETVQNRTGDGAKVDSDGRSLAGGRSVAEASGEAAARRWRCRG